MAFYLFRLPESIYIDIINTMNPCEQFFTSLCSRKTYSIIKTHRRPIHDFGIHTEGDFDFHLDDCVTIFMRFHQSSEPSNQELEELIIDGNTIRYELKEDNLTTYWAEPREGTMKLIEYMCDLFNIEVEEMVVHCDSTNRLMNWIQSRQTHLCVVSFTSNDSEENQFDPETLTSLIMDCQIAKSIKLDAYTTEPFQIQNLQKRCDCFHVDIGTWVTVENLMTMDCIDILVTRKPFTSTEMNRFIKHWINGGSPRLAFLGVALEDYNEQELMDGIDVKYNIRKHFRKGTTGYIHKLDGFYEIQKTTNGMKAGFKYKDGVLFFAVWPSHLFLNPPCCFRLFRLPHLVFMNIINAMEATEQ
uniref:F-box domain-containing protein n=1 Tax=Caenorhabditis tropicalis TaxID=1561998 RepID=A0A1I7UN02_9PELO